MKFPRVFKDTENQETTAFHVYPSAFYIDWHLRICIYRRKTRLPTPVIGSAPNHLLS